MTKSQVVEKIESIKKDVEVVLYINDNVSMPIRGIKLSTSNKPELKGKIVITGVTEKSNIEREMKKRGQPLERTISIELHNAWKANKRYDKDAERISIEAAKAGLPASKPTIEKALLHGFCPNSDLKDFITKYFVKRNEAEKKQAAMLMETTPNQS